ncbi:polynucleotide adenylyltransferase PcnB [Solimonas soli]|uniref:polynucleotide adenylyltransferase PcnB n=1 Tax=Solimonas soli TaxID=413479 RepID=UPI0004B12466|nr:polynucleotide adenylyltransferase PcnB [Solimonas soli]
MNWLKTLFPRNKKIPAPKRVPRAEHPISRSQLPSGTLKVLYGLKDAGFEAYVVGGGVRDLLAGMEPKDFDIATNARPEEVRQIFRSCRLVGRRFVIAHVRFGDEISEVTTFRGPITDSHERDETGRILADNEYGTLETDAFRRDFTVNALYYDIRDFSIVDFAGGLDDIKAGVIRLIGDPELRYREDPVRMLRAVRIANKLKFHIEKSTAAPIRKLAPLLREIPPARLFDEVVKLLQCRDGVANLQGLREYGLLAHLLPHTDMAMAKPQSRDFVERALANTAERIVAEQTVSPAFLYAALLWPAVQARTQQLCKGDSAQVNVAIAEASEEVLAKAQQHIVIPKRFSVPMREIWALQPRFDMRRGGRAQRLLTHPRFRAAYDFLLLRAASGEAPQELADWWTQAQTGSGLPPVTATESNADGEGAPRKRRRRRGGRNRRRPSEQPTAGE